jgi:hypothetical protein
MHLKRRPSQLFKLLAGDSAALALVAVKVETFLAFSPPRRTDVVGAVGHGRHLLVRDWLNIPQIELVRA